MLQVDAPIETERLVLRPFVAEDLDALSAIHGREDITRFLYWGPRDREEARAALTSTSPARRFAVRAERSGSSSIPITTAAATQPRRRAFCCASASRS